MTGTTWDRCFANLITALEAISATTRDANSTVDQDSAAAGTTLYVAATTGFTAGEMVLVNRGGVREEVVQIATVNTGVSLTTATALTYTHTATQTDVVEQGWYWHTVANAKSAGGLGFQAGNLPWCGAVALDQVPYDGGDISTQYQYWTRGVRVELMNYVALKEPLDQDNDEEYQKCLHDIMRAVTRSRTRGGYAIDTSIVSAEMITLEQTDERAAEIPTIGARVALAIDYRHKIGDLYL